MELLGWLAAAVMGLTLGVIGGGGSILTVPIFVYLFGIPATQATGYSLFVVGATSLVGAFTYMRRGMVDLKTAAIFAPPALVSVYLTRRYLVPALPDPVLSMGSFTLSKDKAFLLLFALLMLASAVAMIREKAKPTEEVLPREHHLALPKIVLEGAFVGVLTGLVGAGGGFLIIPALVLFAGVPMKIAVGTSLLIIAAKSLLGFIGDVQASGNMDWKFLLIATGVAIAGIVVGVMLSGKLSNEKLKPAFGWFLVAMGGYIVGKEFIF